MKCVNCGAEIPEGKKFCGNCGNPVESADSIQSEEVKENESESFNEEVSNEPVEEVATAETVEEPAFTSEVSNEPQRQEIVQEPIPVDTKEFKNEQEKAKKSSGAVKYIFIILIAAILIAGGVFAYFKFFNKESYSKSVDSVEKAIENLQKKTDESATIKAKIEMAIKDSLSLDFSLLTEYEKNDDDLKLHLRLDKNILTDQIDLYGEMNKTTMTVYIPSSLITLIDDSLDFGTGEYWFKYSMDLDELGIDLSELESEDEGLDLDLSKVLTEENFKYVGKKNGLKQYSLTIDKNYLSKYKDELDEIEDFSGDVIDAMGDMKFYVNFYVDGKNCLSKIEMDLKEIGNTMDTEFTKLLFTIEFSGFNTTKVEIPSSVKTSSIDVNSFIDEDTTATKLF